MALLSLIAKLGLDKTGFEAGMNSAGKRVSAFGASLKGQLAAAFGTAAIAAYVKNLAAYASSIEDGARKAGVSKKALQEFGYAATQSGAQLDDVVKSMKALSLARQEALADPKSKAAQAFGALGIGADELGRSNLEQLFRRIGNEIQRTDFGAGELAIMNELLGRSGQSLLPAFIEGLDQAAAEANRLGIVLEDAGIKRLDEMGDAVDRLKAELRGPASEAVIFFADTVVAAFKRAKKEFEDVANFWTGFAGGVAGTESKERLPWWTGAIRYLPGTRGAVPKARAGAKAGLEQVEQGEKERDAKELADKLTQVVLGIIGSLPFQGGGAARRTGEFQFAGKEEQESSKRAKAAKDTAEIRGDALGRIGGTIGGGNTVQSELKKHTDQLRKIHERLRTGITIRDL